MSFAESAEPEAVAPLQLTETQQSVVDFLKNPPTSSGILRIDGPAGTGKSTLLGALVRALGNRVTIAATTNKAARVAALKSGVAVGTADSLVRKPAHIEREDRGILDQIATRGGRMILKSSEKEITPGHVLVVDEASMIDRSLYEALIEYTDGGWLVLVGDAFQMRPVAAGSFNVFAEPGIKTITLDRIFRHGADSSSGEGADVLEAVTNVRREFFEGTALSPLPCLSGLPHIELHQALEEMKRGYEKYGSEFISISFKNATRQQLTEAYRQFLGYPKNEIIPGEPIMITANSREHALSNGDLCEFVRWEGAPIRYSVDKIAIHVRKATIKTPPGAYGSRRTLEVGLLLYAGPAYDYETQRKLEKKLRDGVVQAEMAYVLTGHKSQGSQWKSVLLYYDEIWSSDREGRYRWCYTTASRASEKCTVCVLPRSLITASSFEVPKPPSPEIVALFARSA